MYAGKSSLSLLFFSVLVLGGSLIAGEASFSDEDSYLEIERSEYNTQTEDSAKSGNQPSAATVAGRAERGDRDKASVVSKSPKGSFENDSGNVMVKFEYSGCVLREPSAARAYSEREIYSILLAFSDSGAKTAKPIAESKDKIDKGARQAASRMIALQEEGNARIREIMLKEKMDFDSSVSGFANQVTAEISPRRYEGATGRNILPYAARHHAIVIALALEALQFSDDEDARELAYDLIVDHSKALTEVKELQQEG